MAKNKIKYSIVVATRNRDKTLRFLLKSLALQSFPQNNYEVVTVNYGGTSTTEKLVKSFNKRNFKYLYVDESGIFNESHSKNIGIKSSKGKVIIVTNADIIFTKDTLKEFDIEYSKSGKNYLYQVIRYDMPEEFDVNKNFDGLLNRTISLRKFKSQDETACGDFQAAEKSSWFSVNGYDELMSGWGGMDLDLVDRMRMVNHQQKWIKNSNLLIYHQYHPTKAPAKTQANLFLRSLNKYPKVNYKNWGEVNKAKRLFVAIHDMNNHKNRIKLINQFKNIFLGLDIELAFNSSKDKNPLTPKSFFQSSKVKALKGNCIGYLEIDKLHLDVFKNLKVIKEKRGLVDLILTMNYMLEGAPHKSPVQYNLRYFDMRLVKILSSINLKSLKYFYTEELISIAQKIGIDICEIDTSKENFENTYHTIKFTIEKIKYKYRL